MKESTIASYDLRYGSERFNTPDGLELYYEIRGSGPVVLIINNFFIIAPLWRNFTRTLEKTHTIISFDLRNQGASSPVDGEIVFSSLVADVRHLLDHLDIAQAYIVGTSTSTLIARDFALAHPERVKGMILVGPLFCPYGSRRRKFLTRSWLATLDRGGVAGLFEHIFPLIYSDRTIESGGSPAFLALRERFTAVNSHRQLEQFLRASLTTDDDPAKLKRVEVPVKLVVGEADFLQSPSSLAATVGLLPRGELEVVPHSGHVPYFEATERFERSIADLVARIEATGAQASDPAQAVELRFAIPDLVEAVRASIAAHGDRPAVSRGQETWSYAQLGANLAAIAAGLAADTEGPILYAPSNSPIAVATILAAIAAKRVPVLPDPTWTDAEWLEVVRRCGIRSIVSERTLSIPWLARERRIGELYVYDAVVSADERDDVTPRDHTAFCRFTSGTTGFSRCLEFSSAAAIAAARSWWRAVRYSVDDVVLCLATLNNGLAFNTSLLSVLLAGAHLVFHGGPMIPSAIAATSRRVQPTVLVAFPFVYDALATGRHQLDASRLRLAISSAAPLKDTSAEAFRATHGIAICNYYGLVEAGPCTFNDGTVEGSVGYRLDGVDFKHTGGDEPGQLRVRSASMASGFLDRHGPPLSDSFDDNGYYVTNDLALLGEHGHLYLRGRLGRLMNIEGRKVDPGEVERVIRSVEGVTDAVVREETAGGRALIAAYVEGHAIAADALIEVFRHQLAPYKRPQRVHVVPDFPRSAAGKVLFNQLVAGES